MHQVEGGISEHPLTQNVQSPAMWRATSKYLRMENLSGKDLHIDGGLARRQLGSPASSGGRH